MTTEVTFTVKAQKSEVGRLLAETRLEDEDIQENGDGTVSITCHDPDFYYWAHNVRQVLLGKYPDSFEGPEDW